MLPIHSAKAYFKRDTLQSGFLNLCTQDIRQLFSRDLFPRPKLKSDLDGIARIKAHLHLCDQKISPANIDNISVTVKREIVPKARSYMVSCSTHSWGMLGSQLATCAEWLALTLMYFSLGLFVSKHCTVQFSVAGLARLMGLLKENAEMSTLSLWANFGTL